MTTRRASDDRVLLTTRVVSAAIIPFLVLAFVVLFLWPSDTKRLFAWQIKPTMSPMVLGSVYLGGAYFFGKDFPEFRRTLETICARAAA